MYKDLLYDTWQHTLRNSYCTIADPGIKVFSGRDTLQMVWVQDLIWQHFWNESTWEHLMATLNDISRL